MNILSIRTDKPQSELGLFENDQKVDYLVWEAHRSLAETIHVKIDVILNKSSITREQLDGIVVFSGPGSFTGLRIGLSVANAMAYGLKIPVVGKRDTNWLKDGLADILAGKNDVAAKAQYGEPAKTTKQIK